MLSRFFIDRPIFASVISILFTLAGAVAVFHLPIAQYPPVAPPTVQVDCNYPGASSKVVAETVAAGVLVLYRRVKAAKTDELGVAAVHAATCRGCNVSLPPQMYNDLQRNDRLKHCPNCDRIIYWEEEDRPE